VALGRPRKRRGGTPTGERVPLDAPPHPHDAATLNTCVCRRSASFICRKRALKSVLRHCERLVRHCERSEAIQSGSEVLDCFVAPPLAMTAGSFAARNDGWNRWLVGETRARLRRGADGVRPCRHRGQSLLRHCERSEAIQRAAQSGLLRRFAARNDGRNRWLENPARNCVGRMECDYAFAYFPRLKKRSFWSSVAVSRLDLITPTLASAALTAGRSSIALNQRARLGLSSHFTPWAS
jgi:hypothetical protein